MSRKERETRKMAENDVCACVCHFFLCNFAADLRNFSVISYMQMALLDVLNLLKGIQTEGDYMEFRNILHVLGFRHAPLRMLENQVIVVESKIYSLLTHSSLRLSDTKSL